jgi:hypothetical protein
VALCLASGTTAFYSTVVSEVSTISLTFTFFSALVKLDFMHSEFWLGDVGERQFTDLNFRGEDIVKTDLTEIGCEDEN